MGGVITLRVEYQVYWCSATSIGGVLTLWVGSLTPWVECKVYGRSANSMGGVLTLWVECHCNLLNETQNLWHLYLLAEAQCMSASTNKRWLWR